MSRSAASLTSTRCSSSKPSPDLDRWMARRPEPRELPARAAQIIAAARELLESEGRDALTMRRLGQALGIRAPSIYKHLPGKHAVEVALMEAGFAEIGEALHGAVAKAQSRKQDGTVTGAQPGPQTGTVTGAQPGPQAGTGTVTGAQPGPQDGTGTVTGAQPGPQDGTGTVTGAQPGPQTGTGTVTGAQP